MFVENLGSTEKLKKFFCLAVLTLRGTQYLYVLSYIVKYV